jgi:thiosulfate/3-mercaptopyruvate sulfurtransferase
MTGPWGPLVGPDGVAARLDDPSLRIVDLRLAADGGRAAHEAGHIPGAVFSDYAGDGWRSRVGDAPGMLPDATHLAALFGRLGITPDRHVLLAPAGTNANDLAASARAYWTLKTVGHRSVAILDGGYAGWIADPARPVERGWRAVDPAPPYPVALGQALRATAAESEAALTGGLASFVDARSPSYFEGREKAAEAARAGRIPGAISRDYAALFDPTRHGLRPASELRALFAAVPAGAAIAYCNTGHTAALDWFVMSEILGRKDVRLYDGSMTDWTQDASRPVESG